MDSVANIVQSADVESQIAYRQATGELNRAQADVLRAQQPYVAQKMLAEIQVNNATTEARRQEILRSKTLLPHEREKLLADIRRDDAATNLSNAQASRVRDLVKFEQDQITANINRDNAAAGLSRANEKRIDDLFPLEKQELEKKIGQYVTVEFDTKSGKQTGTVTAAQLLNELNESRSKLADRIAKHEAEKRQVRQDEAKSRETAAKYKNHIEQRSPGGYKMGSGGDAELSSDVDMYHSTSRDPYVYIFQKEPGLVGSTPRYKRFDLPKDREGKQLTAREIYDAAEAEQGGMTVQQYLEQVLYPYLQQKIPWNTAVTSTIPLTQTAVPAPTR